jgi:hypothetical protein
MMVYREETLLTLFYESPRIHWHICGNHKIPFGCRSDGALVCSMGMPKFGRDMSSTSFYGCPRSDFHLGSLCRHRLESHVGNVGTCDCWSRCLIQMDLRTK